MASAEITPPQQLLLQACLASDSDFPDLLGRWQESVELDDVDYGSHRLLPYLYRKLERLGLTIRDQGRLRGIYARFWALHQTRATPALDAVADLPTQYLVLKGTALQTMVYGNDPATRPSDDVDVLVHPRDRERALRHLLRAGFNFEVELPLETYLHLRKGASLLRAGVAVDLHWNIFYWSRDPKLIDRMFQRAIQLDYRGRPLLSLCPTDTLLHTVTHGYGTNRVPPIRWVLDAALLIRSGQIDWTLFEAEAMASGWARATASQLKLLTEMFGISLPAGLMSRLGSRGSRLDYALQWAHLRANLIWGKRLARLAGWDARVLASNIQRKASLFELVGLMWREFRWLKKRNLLAR